MENWTEEGDNIVSSKNSGSSDQPKEGGCWLLGAVESSTSLKEQCGLGYSSVTEGMPEFKQHPNRTAATSQNHYQ